MRRSMMYVLQSADLKWTVFSTHTALAVTFSEFSTKKYGMSNCPFLTIVLLEVTFKTHIEPTKNSFSFI